MSLSALLRGEIVFTTEAQRAQRNWDFEAISQQNRSVKSLKRDLEREIAQIKARFRVPEFEFVKEHTTAEGAMPHMRKVICVLSRRLSHVSGQPGTRPLNSANHGLCFRSQANGQ